MDNINSVIEDLVAWLQEQVGAAHAQGLVFGLSGGIDSAVMAGLAKRAFPEDSLGIIMPCHSNQADEEDALLVAKSLGLRTAKVDLSSSFDSLLAEADLEESSQLARSNVKPRLRMTTLYFYGQSLGYLVAGPTNKSEFVTGYFTKHGDSAVDLLPLVDFTKSEIYELARALEIPEKIIKRVPSAGLWEDQSDEDEMGFTYDVLEKYINQEEIEDSLYKKIRAMDDRSKHKRTYPPIYKK